MAVNDLPRLVVTYKVSDVVVHDLPFFPPDSAAYVYSTSFWCSLCF